MAKVTIDQNDGDMIIEIYVLNSCSGSVKAKLMRKAQEYKDHVADADMSDEVAIGHVIDGVLEEGWVL